MSFYRFNRNLCGIICCTTKWIINEWHGGPSVAKRGCMFSFGPGNGIRCLGQNSERRNIVTWKFFVLGILQAWRPHQRSACRWMVSYRFAKQSIGGFLILKQNILKLNILGDIGEWQPDGSMKIIDRKKNIFKLSQGEYVAVENLENIFSVIPTIDAVILF